MIQGARRDRVLVVWTLLPLVLVSIGASPVRAAPTPPGSNTVSYTVAPDTIPDRPDLFEAPVYYERNYPRYVRNSDVDHLRAGRVRLQHYEPVDVTHFAWRQAGVEYTWWMQMQDLRFILPLVASKRSSDRKLAKEWLSRWYDVHVTGGIHPGQWGEPMTFAYRAMVFVYYLKCEQRRERPDPDVVEMLSTCILAHQQHLVPNRYFDDDNNHGMIDALGLLETTRVFPNDEARSLAFERIQTMVAKSVSSRGVHLEHAAGYHFVFLRWVDEILDYARDLPGAPPAFVAAMERASKRMRAAAYFLQDHRGWIPPIGDTDSVSVYYYASDYRFEHPPGNATGLYDSEAGYAIFKGRVRGSDARYVVFRQPSEPIAMYAHAHSDALAVLVGWDGEVLLGDSGRYTYTRGAGRDYFVSRSAHNTVLPPAQSRAHRSHLPIVTSASDVSSPDTTMWTADLDFGLAEVTRVVRIPAGGRDIVVNDAVFATSVDGSLGVPAPSTVTILWNVGRDVEELALERDGDGGIWSWKLTTRRGRHARLELEVRGDGAPKCASVDVVRGREEPMLGWYSPRQAVKRPVSAIVVTLNVDRGVYLETRVRLPPR